MTIWNLLSKIRTVYLSRFKKTKKQPWIEERTEICNSCEFNTKNINEISFKQKVARVLSNILTLVTTGKFNEDDSECSICYCTLSFKIPEKEETCLKGKWKSIYTPNSAQKEKWKTN